MDLFENLKSCVRSVCELSTDSSYHESKDQDSKFVNEIELHDITVQSYTERVVNNTMLSQNELRSNFTTAGNQKVKLYNTLQFLNFQSDFRNAVKAIIAEITPKDQEEVFIEFSSRDEMVDGFFDFAYRTLPILLKSAQEYKRIYLQSKLHSIRTLKTELVKLVVFSKHIITITYSDLIAKVRFDEDDFVDQISQRIMSEISHDQMSKLKSEYSLVLNKFQKVITKYRNEKIDSDEWNYFFRGEGSKITAAAVWTSVDEQCVGSLLSFRENQSPKFKLECVKLLVDRTILNLKKQVGDMRLQCECEDIANIILVCIVKAQAWDVQCHADLLKTLSCGSDSFNMFGQLRISLEQVVNVLAEQPEDKLSKVEDLKWEKDDQEDTAIDSHRGNMLNHEKMNEEINGNVKEDSEQEFMTI